MAKIIQVGTTIEVKTLAGRFRHAVVKTVTNQNTLSVSIDKATAFTVTKASSSPNSIRGYQYNQ